MISKADLRHFKNGKFSPLSLFGKGKPRNNATDFQCVTTNWQGFGTLYHLMWKVGRFSI